MSGAPGYWRYEASGVLAPVVRAYIEGKDLTPEQIPIMRAYLRQWIFAGAWQGAPLEGLRARVDGLQTQADITRWIWDALGEGIDPL